MVAFVAFLSFLFILPFPSPELRPRHLGRTRTVSMVSQHAHLARLINPKTSETLRRSAVNHRGLSSSAKRWRHRHTVLTCPPILSVHLAEEKAICHHRRCGQENRNWSAIMGHWWSRKKQWKASRHNPHHAQALLELCRARSLYRLLLLALQVGTHVLESMGVRGFVETSFVRCHGSTGWFFNMHVKASSRFTHTFGPSLGFRLWFSLDSSDLRTCPRKLPPEPCCRLTSLRSVLPARRPSTLHTHTHTHTHTHMYRVRNTDINVCVCVCVCACVFVCACVCMVCMYMNMLTPCIYTCNLH